MGKRNSLVGTRILPLVYDPMIPEVTNQSLLQHRFTAPRHYTWEQLSFDFQFGDVLFLEKVGSLMFMVRRGGSSLAGYIGVPEGCLLRGLGDDDAGDIAPFHCECTWAGELGGLENYSSSEYYYSKLKDYYWFGWDYAHYPDCFMWGNKDDIPDFIRNSFFYGFTKPKYGIENIKWDLQMVLDDSEHTVDQFVKYHRKVCGC